MSTDLKENIILPAWKTVMNDRKLKKFYFIPGLLSILLLTVLLVYQSIYTYVVVFGRKDEAFDVILNFFHSQYIIEIIVVAVVFILLYLLIFPVSEGALIKYIDAKNKGDDLSIGDAVGIGLYRFLPLFEYNNIFSEFKFISILNGYLFSIRFVGVEYIKYVSYLFLIVFFLSIIINVLFAYSKYEIIVGNKKAFPSIGGSSKIAILNFQRTIKIYFLMFLLNIRVIINFIIFLSFPVLIIGAIGLITSQFLSYLAVGILVTLFVLFILFLSYLTAVLDIFKTAIWYYAYIEGKKRVDSVDK